MQQQSRHKYLGQDFDPINLVVESVQLPAVMEGEENEGNQAENVEVHRARRVPTTRKNEEAYEEIDQAYNSRVILNRGRFLRWSSNEWSLKLLAIPCQFVAHLGPQPRAPQSLGYLHLPSDRAAVNGQNM